MQATYRLYRPDLPRSCVIFASPHSGRAYPPSLMGRTILDARAIRSSEDAFVDQLFAAAPDCGAPLIAAEVPRAYVDLNRSSEELDPALIDGVRRNAHNPRVSSGLGVIPRVVANGRPIYDGKLPLAEVEERIRTHWRPYHAAIQGLLAEARGTFGEAILIDCHSMPHEALDGVVHPDGVRPEIVLGDRFGAAASTEVVAAIEAAFREAGFAVVRNAPFAGAYSTQRYGRPGQRQHVVQVEIDRALYMDERAIAPHAGFKAVQRRMNGVVARIAAIGRDAVPLAAE